MKGRRGSSGFWVQAKKGKKIAFFKRREVLFALLAFFLALLAYGRFFGIQLMEFDAVSKIVSHSGAGAGEFFKILTQPEEHYLFFSRNYRPFETFLFWAIFLFNGMNFTAFHALSFVLHAANAALVFFLARKLLNDKSGFFALIAAALFALQPVTMNSVLFVSRLHEPLVCFAFLASLLCLIRFLEEKKMLFLALAWLFCAIGVFSKETGVLIPAVLLLYCIVFSQEKKIAGRILRSIKLSLPFFAVAGAYLAAMFLVLGRIGGYTFAPNPYRSQLLAFFLGYLFYPIDFLGNNFFQGAKQFLRTPQADAIALILAASGAILLLWFFSVKKKNLQAFFLLAWFFGFMLAFFAFGFIYSWYAYVPLVPFAILLSMMLKGGWEKAKKSKASAAAAAAAGVLFISLFAVSPLFIGYRQPAVASEITQGAFEKLLYSAEALPAESRLYLLNLPRQLMFSENGYWYGSFLLHGGSVQAMLDLRMPEKKFSVVELTDLVVLSPKLESARLSFAPKGDCNFLLENRSPGIASMTVAYKLRPNSGISLLRRTSKTSQSIELRMREKECGNAVFLFFDGKTMRALRAGDANRLVPA